VSEIAGRPDVRGQKVLATVADALMKLFSESLVSEGRVDTDAILTTTTSAIARYVPATCIAIVLKSDPEMSLIVVADNAHPEVASYINDYIATTTRPREGPTGGFSQRVIEAGVPLYIPRMEMSQLTAVMSPPGRKYFEEHGPPPQLKYARMVMAPMRSGPSIVGTLGLFDWLGTDILSEADIDWTQRAADLVGLTIDNAQIRIRANDRLARLAALNELAMTLVSTQDRRLIFRVLVERVVSALGVDAADILLVDEHDSAFSVASSAGFETALIPQFKVPISSEAVRALLDVKINAAADDWMGVRRRSLIAREGFTAYAAAPLRVAGRLLGALEVYNRVPTERDAEWVSVLETIASLAAIVVEQWGKTDALATLGPTGGEPWDARSRFSDREVAILNMLVGGASNQEVAETLHLSLNTIKATVRGLLDKAEVSNRTELAAKAVKERWV
jgi:DNA-binding CsgD family transcriptional regulator